MNNVKRFMIAAVAMMAVLALGASVGVADPNGGEGRRGNKGACKADVERLCGDVSSRKEARQCLMDNQDQLSDACQEHMEHKRQRHEARRAQIEQACGADIQQFCSGIEDHKELRSCMREHREELSDSCTEALKSNRKHRKRGAKKEARKAVKLACAADAEQFCGGIDDRKEMRACMKEHREELSDSCTEAIKDARKARKAHKRSKRNQQEG